LKLKKKRDKRGELKFIHYGGNVGVGPLLLRGVIIGITCVTMVGVYTHQSASCVVTCVFSFFKFEFQYQLQETLKSFVMSDLGKAQYSP